MNNLSHKSTVLFLSSFSPLHSLRGCFDSASAFVFFIRKHCFQGEKLLCSLCLVSPRTSTLTTSYLCDMMSHVPSQKRLVVSLTATLEKLVMFVCSVESRVIYLCFLCFFWIRFRCVTRFFVFLYATKLSWLCMLSLRFPLAIVSCWHFVVRCVCCHLRPLFCWLVIVCCFGTIINDTSSSVCRIAITVLVDSHVGTNWDHKKSP